MFTFQIVRNKSTLCTAKRFRRAATGCSLGKYPRQHLTTLSLLMDGGGGGKPANGAFFLIFMGICALVG